MGRPKGSKNKTSGELKSNKVRHIRLDIDLVEYIELQSENFGVYINRLIREDMERKLNKQETEV